MKRATHTSIDLTWVHLWQSVLKSWADNLMMDRKTAKTYAIDEFNQIHQTLTANRRKAIEKGGEELHLHLVSVVLVACCCAIAAMSQLDVNS